MYPTTRDLVAALDAAGELRTIRDRVSPVLEIAAIADAASKSRAPSPPSEAARRNDPRFHDRGGPALFFTNVEGSDVPVLINAYGSYRRMEMALGCERHAAPGFAHTGFEAIAARIAELVTPRPPRSLGEAMAMAKRFAPLLRIRPKRVKSGLCHEVVLTRDQIDLTRWPLLRCWPLDGDLEAVGYPADINDHLQLRGTGVPPVTDWNARFRGRYITFGGVHTIHADDADGSPSSKPPASHNIGMYRAQLLGPRHLAMHWHMHHDGAAHWRSWKRRGEPMPVAIALGGESVLPYAATAPLPPGVSELLMAGFLNRRGIELTKARTVPLWVPANAEIVIEGFVSTEAGDPGWDPRPSSLQSPASGLQSPASDLGPGAVFEGPFGDHTGFYSMPDRYPIMEVTAITHRRDPIYPTTIVGLPPQEDYFLGKATERLFLPLLRTLIPDIEDYDLPLFGAFHNCAFLRIKKQYPLHARRVMHAVWGAGQMSWTKNIFVVDGDVDVHDTEAVLRAAAAHCAPAALASDLEFVRGPLDILDHAAPHLGAGTKLGFDCTRKIDGEQWGGCGGRVLPPPREPLTAAAAAQLIAAARALPGVTDAALHAGEGGGGWLFLAIDAAAIDESVAALLGRLLDSLAREAGPRSSPANDRSARPTNALPPYIIAVAHTVDIHNLDEAMFHYCANTDPGSDSIRGNGSIAFDATPKRPEQSNPDRPVRPWPPIIAMDEPIRRKAESLLAQPAAKLG
jgi:4-hydroxy-3-polyprenylbenzoate decarboxylase